MAMGRGHHRPTNSTASGASAFSSTDFQYGAVGSQQWGDPPLNYYYDDNNNNNDSPPPQDCQKCDGCCACISRVCGGCCVFAPRGPGIWAVSSFVFWAVLWGFAASYPTEQQFVLNVGETWQVSTPPLWSRSTFEIYSYNPAMPMMATSTDGISAEPPEVGVEVYAFSPVMEGKNAKCPLPSPETAKKLHDTVTISLKGAAAGGRGGDSGSESGRQYQYSYYHLNQGSKLSVDILQKKGSANIYLLQGYAALKSLEDDTSSASSSASFPPDFRRKSILKRYSGQGGETTFVYEAAVADFYILVYDNASTTTISSSSSSSSSGSSFSSKLIAQIDIDMAIHPLALQRRVCDAQQTSLQGGCLWKLSSYVDRRRVQASCIIVKAISTTSTSDDSSSGGESGSGSGVIANANSSSNNNKDNDIDIDDSQVVGVRLQAKVGSVNLTLIASLPLLIGIFFLCREYGSDCIRRKKRRPSQGEDEVEEEPRLLWKKSSTSTKNNNRQHPRNTNYLSVLTNEDPEKLVASNTTNNSNYNNNNNNNMMMPTVAEKSASTTTSGSSYQKTIY